MKSLAFRRRVWLCFALGVVGLGLGVHFLGFGLSGGVRDFVGDALWAVMIFAWLGVLWPYGGLPARAALALVICWAVEISQSYHAPLLDSWRRTTLGQLVLGSGFDPRDLVAYAFGVLVGGVLESIAKRQTARYQRAR